ncbi:MAG: phosphopyruvate hydratase [Candidatus Micrarchaeia archaeon]
MSFEIASVFAREILDSRGNPTVEVDVKTRTAMGRAAAPSGASTGVHEALELRDGGKRYLGKGVIKAVRNVNTIIARELRGYDVRNQKKIDEKLIELGGPNKAKLGANATTATSMAAAKAAANALNLPLFRYLGGVKACVLPVPQFNILNGGKHAGTKLSIQEFMIMPVGARSFSEALRMGSETYHHLGSILTKKYGAFARNVGDEGGFAPPIEKAEDALRAIQDAVDSAGYTKQVSLAIDAAASSFYDEKTHQYRLDGKSVSSNKLLEFYEELVENFPIVSIEDPFFEEDFESFAELNASIGKKVQIVGDDLVVTNVGRIQQAIEKRAMNALLLKVNQIGTLTEAIEAAELVRKHRYGVVVSHRSGETDDSTIADLVVAINGGQIKTGAPARGERVAKYNQLLRIEEMLGKRARYAGKKFRYPV